MITCKKALFDLDPEVTFLNTAYMSPSLKAVAAAGREKLDQKMRPYTFTDKDFFAGPENLKRSFSQLIHNSDPGRIAFIPSVSYGIENCVRNIPFQAGDEIVVASEQFPSNIYPWMAAAEKNQLKIVVAKSPSSMDRKTQIWNDRILSAINPKTKVVALPQVHWAEGIVFDLKEIRKRCNEVGAYLIIDGTQSVGAFPFSVEEIQPDCLVCAGYKWLMGAYGFGLAYYGPRFDNGFPIENNWINRLHSEDFTGLVNYQPLYKAGANRYSVGEHSNFVAVAMLEESIKHLLEWTPEGIQEYCASITDGLGELQNKGFEIVPPSERAHHLIGVKVPNHLEVNKIKQALKTHNILASVRGRYIRIAPYVFNESKDIDKLVEIFFSRNK